MDKQAEVAIISVDVLASEMTIYAKLMTAEEREDAQE